MGVAEEPQATGSTGMGVRRFRRVPLEVEAVTWGGYNVDEVREFVGGEWVDTHPPEQGKHSLVDNELRVWNTDTRQHTVIPYGHWVVKGTAGEFYPCSPEVLEKTYEPVDQAEAVESA